MSVALHGRYVPAFAEIGARIGGRGVLIAALVALGFMVAAFCVRVWGSSYLSASTVWDEERHSETLVIAGPFRFVRHPLYLGNLLLAIGAGAAAPLVGWIMIVIANVAFVLRLIGYEERGFAEAHPGAFAAYRASVPALLPRPFPIAATSAAHARLAQGLRSESFTGFLVLGLVGLFAVPRFGWIVLVVCYLAGTLTQRTIERA